MNIQNKVVIITGASSGIGLATAKLLTLQGARVVLAARSEDKLKEISKNLPDSLVVKTDMHKGEDIRNLVDKTIEKYGKLDILINNAGRGMYGPLENVDIENYKEIMELNVYATLIAMKLVIPIMKSQGGGMIINISSMVSKMYIPYLSAYASTKYALNALSLTAREELKKDNIIVSVMHPKMTATNFGLNAINSRRDSRATGEVSPEVDTPEQVAKKIAELIISEASEAQM